MLFASVPIYAAEENVNIQMFVKGEGNVSCESHTADEKNPVSFTVPKGKRLVFQVEGNDSSSPSVFINNGPQSNTTNTYPWIATEDTKVQVEWTSKKMERAQTIRVEGFSYHEYSIPNMGTWNECVFRLNTGVQGFCGESSLAGIRYHQYLEEPIIINSPSVRKVLYYGHLGPQDILTSRYGLDAAVCITNELCSKAYSGITAAEIVGMNGGWDRFLRPIYEEIQSKPDPYDVGYTAYACRNFEQGVNWQGNVTRRQDLLYGKLNAPRLGSLQILKQSSQPDITKDNSHYSLANAKYGLYTRYEDAQQKRNEKVIFTTDGNGQSQVEKLVPSTYYIRELQAPKGYLLHDEIQSVIVTANQTQVLKEGIFTDVPKVKHIGIVLKKLDSKTNQPLQGAEFSIQYFKPGAKEPSKTWNEVTNEKGEINDLEIPYGTIRIQETKAPQGYILSKEIIEREVSEVYNAPTILNAENTFIIEKVQKNTKQPISQAEFEHTMPDGSKETVKTDAQGKIVLKQLQKGKHTLIETKVKSGYELNPTRYEWIVSADGKIEGAAQPLIIEDEVSDYSIEILKKNENKKPLDGAEFTIYRDAACKNPMETNRTQQGKVVFSHLKNNTKYYVKEVKAPQGYTLPQTPHIYEIYTQSNPEKGEFTIFVDGKATQGSPIHRVVQLEIINHTGKVLPFTGSFTSVLCVIAGIGMMVIAGKGKRYA